MQYPYRCNKCEHRWDVFKSVKDIDNPEPCSNCGTLGERYLTPCYFHGEKVFNAYYNHGLGTVVQSKSEYNEIVKRRGLIEIGNEKPETINKYYDTRRQEKIDKKYDNVEKEFFESKSITL